MRQVGKARVMHAEAVLDAKKAEYRIVEATLVQNKVNVDQVQAEVKLRETEVARLKQLAEAAAVQQAELMQAEYLLLRAKTGLEAARAGLAGAEARIEVATANIKKAEAELLAIQAEAQLAGPNLLQRIERLEKRVSVLESRGK
jgi:multidrug resistance efflux pump